MSSAKLPYLSLTSRGASLTSFWPHSDWTHRSQLGYFQCHQLSPLFSVAFDDAFDQLELIRVTLIFIMNKNLIMQINYVHIDIYHKNGYWFKIRMGFLWLILDKIKNNLPAASHATAGWGPRGGKPALGCRIGWTGLMGWSGYAHLLSIWAIILWNMAMNKKNQLRHKL